MKKHFTKALKYFKYSFIIFSILFWVIMIAQDLIFIKKHGAETLENVPFWFLFYFAYSLFFTFFYWLVSSLGIIVYHKFIKTLGILLVISFTSCISIKPNSIKNTMLEENSLVHIDGFYSNVSNSKTDAYNASLWKQFNYLKKDTLANWQNHTIELEVVNKKRIRAKLWLNDTVIAEKTIKGKIRGGYFSVRRNVKISGFPLVYFFSSDNKLEIGSSKNNQLIINSATSSYGMIFIMTNGNTQQFTSKFERK